MLMGCVAFQLARFHCRCRCTYYAAIHLPRNRLAIIYALPSMLGPMQTEVFEYLVKRLKVTNIQ